MNISWLLRTLADAVDEEGSVVTDAVVIRSLTWRGGEFSLRLGMNLGRSAYDRIEDALHHAATDGHANTAERGSTLVGVSPIKATPVKTTKGGEPLTIRCPETVGFVLDTEWVVSCDLPAVEALHDLSHWTWTCPVGHENETPTVL